MLFVVVPALPPEFGIMKRILASLGHEGQSLAEAGIPEGTPQPVRAGDPRQSLRDIARIYGARGRTVVAYAMSITVGNVVSHCRDSIRQAIERDPSDPAFAEVARSFCIDSVKKRGGRLTAHLNHQLAVTHDGERAQSHVLPQRVTLRGETFEPINRPLTDPSFPFFSMCEGGITELPLCRLEDKERAEQWLEEYDAFRRLVSTLAVF